MRKIDKIIIHCSDSDLPQHDNKGSIYKWHVEENGWDDIGYHYLITKSGQVHACRRLGLAGAHCRGHNASSIGICLTGRHEFTYMQIASLRKLVDDLQDTYEVDEIHGHNYYDPKKSCPNFNVDEALERGRFA